MNQRNDCDTLASSTASSTTLTQAAVSLMMSFPQNRRALSTSSSHSMFLAIFLCEYDGFDRVDIYSLFCLLFSAVIK